VWAQLLDAVFSEKAGERGEKTLPEMNLMAILIVGRYSDGRE
jgi:hypothetical protein